jgi:hypothetical protein
VRRDALMEASSLLDTPHGKDIDMKDRPPARPLAF